MKFFRSKGDDQQGQLPVRSEPVGVISSVVSSFVIGARARYVVDLNEATRMETLIIGYCINDTLVFQNRDVSFTDGQLWLVSDIEDALISNVENFGLLVPSDTGEERKLDYQTRVSLGRRGPFGVGKLISMMSLNARRENLKLNTTVRRNLVLKEGIHSGHTVAILDVDMNSVEPFESRAQARVEINIAAMLSIVDKEATFAAHVLDISERALRLVLNPPDTPASALKIKTHVTVEMRVGSDRPPIVLRGEIMQQRQREYIIEIQKIQRRNQFVNFELLDAMELKIALQEMSP